MTLSATMLLDFDEFLHLQPTKVWLLNVDLTWCMQYMEVSIISGTGADICITVIVTLESQCTKFHAAGWTCWFFTSFYLELCIWPHLISQWTRQRNSIKFCANLGKVWQRPWHWLERNKAQAVHRKSKLTETEKGETGEEQSQEHDNHFLLHQWECSQRSFPGRPNSQFRILLWHFTVTAWRCFGDKKLAVS
jgi:hypothetical protein